MRRQFRVLVLILLLIPAGLIPQSIALAKSVAPKVKAGDCLVYDPKVIYSQTIAGKIVDCARSHNAEIYRIFKLSNSQNLNNLDDLQRYEFANSKCQPWSKPSKEFNQWVFRYPSKANWSKGDRLLRCEAIITQPSAEDATVLIPIKWTGKKLDFK